MRVYKPEAVPSEEDVASRPDEAPVVAEINPPETAPAPSKSRRLVITMAQTSDKNSDIACLRKLVDTLDGFSGQDEVILRLQSDDKVDNLKLPGTNYCPDLHRQLAELVGEEAIVVEPLSL